MRSVCRGASKNSTHLPKRLVEGEKESERKRVRDQDRRREKVER